MGHPLPPPPVAPVASLGLCFFWGWYPSPPLGGGAVLGHPPRTTAGVSHRPDPAPCTPYADYCSLFRFWNRKRLLASSFCQLPPRGNPHGDFPATVPHPVAPLWGFLVAWITQDANRSALLGRIHPRRDAARGELLARYPARERGKSILPERNIGVFVKAWRKGGSSFQPRDYCRFKHPKMPFPQSPFPCGRHESVLCCGVFLG